MTMVDWDAVTFFPIVVGDAVWSVRPGDDPELLGGGGVPGGLFDAIKEGLGLSDLPTIPTGGDPFETEREQWDDGNNLLCPSTRRGRRV